MNWITPTEKDSNNAVLEKRLWDAADQFRANSGLKSQEYTADEKDRAVVKELENAVQGMRTSLDGSFNQQLQSLLPAFSLFGCPGFADPALRTETTLDVERLLADHPKVHYAGVNGINLPEAYNGLGARNLIFILLKLLEFYQAFLVQATAPEVHMVFIEEPAVHLHPQMQEVFIAQLRLIAAEFEKTIGVVIDHVQRGNRFALPEAVERRERALERRPEPVNHVEPDDIERPRKLRAVPYKEVIAPANFIEERTPFSTKPGAKDAEFENGLVVLGRGWNLYNFNQFLELAASPNIPADNQAGFERIRNLSYVLCSRPKRRLAVTVHAEVDR
jgi:hypothetical protein